MGYDFASDKKYTTLQSQFRAREKQVATNAEREKHGDSFEIDFELGTLERKGLDVLGDGRFVGIDLDTYFVVEGTRKRAGQVVLAGGLGVGGVGDVDAHDVGAWLVRARPGRGKSTTARAADGDVALGVETVV